MPELIKADDPDIESLLGAPVAQTGLATGQSIEPNDPDIEDFLGGTDDPTPVLRNALEKDPQKEADKRALAKQYNTTPEAVEELGDELSVRARADALAKTLQKAPITKQLVSDPENADIASDAVEELSDLEFIGSQFNTGAQATANLKDVAAALRSGATPEEMAVFQARAQAIAGRAEKLGLNRSFMVETFGAAAETVGQIFETLKDPRLPAMVAVGAAGGAATGAALGAAGGGVGALPGAVAGGARGIAAAGAGFFIQASFELEAADAYLGMIEKGIPDIEARYLAAGVGAINAVLETGSTALMLQPLVSAGKDVIKRALGKAVESPEVLQIVGNFVKSYAGNIALNVGTEGMQELTAIAAEELGKQFRPEDMAGLPEEEIAERMGKVLKKAFQSSLVLGAGSPGVRMVQDFRNRAAAAKENGAKLEEFQKKFDKSLLKQRAPELAADHAAQVLGPDTPLFIPAEEILKAAPIFNASDPMALAKALGADEEYFQTQLSLGGDLPITSRAFAQHLMDANLFAALKDHIRRGEDGMTPAEAKEFDDAGVQEEIAALQKPLAEDAGEQQTEQADGATAGGDQANREGGERQGATTGTAADTTGAARGTVSVDFPLATDKETFAPARGPAADQELIVYGNEIPPRAAPSPESEQAILENARDSFARSSQGFLETASAQVEAAFNALKDLPEVSKRLNAVTQLLETSSEAITFKQLADAFDSLESAISFLEKNGASVPDVVNIAVDALDNLRQASEGFSSIESPLVLNTAGGVYRDFRINLARLSDEELAKISGDEGNAVTGEPAHPLMKRALADERAYRQENTQQAKPVEAAPAPLKNTDRLPGLPDKSPSPVPDAVAAAELYAEQSGMPFKRQPEYVIADPERGARIAQAYEEMKHDPSDPQVQAAYQALIEETLAQYQIIKQMNLNIEIIPKGMKDPYGGSSRAAIEDMAKGHLWVYPTDAGFGSQDNIQTDHPLLARTNEFIGDHQLLANDVFRIVHDVFGHAKEGFAFGANGEENAWQTHSLMYSPLAARAMTTETRGQNSWVNFGPHGESNRARPSQTIYAAQKAGLLPEWVATEGRSGDPPKLAPKQEQAVQLAEAELGYREMFKTAAEAGMTPEQYRGYLIAVGQASEAGRKRKEERALKRRLRENSEQWKAEYNRIYEEQLESLSSDPVYSAFDGIGTVRLDREKVIAALAGDEASLAKLPKQKGGRNIFTDKDEPGGLDPDTYAQLHDFAGADLMLFAMMDQPSKQAQAAENAQREIQIKHGHILSERQEIDEAIEALHNDTQGQMLALELNQLRQAQGQGRIKLSLLRQAARNTLQTMHLNGINPRQFYSTEQRLGRLAGKLLRKGDRATAAKAKFQQVLNFEMAKQAFKIQAQIEKDRKWLFKFRRDRSKWTDLPGDYLDHIRILLDNFNIENKGSVARGQEIEAWLKAKKAIGEEIEIPARFIAPGGVQNYMDMTLADWQSFVSKIRELHHRGVTERKLLKAQEKATIDERAAEVRAQIDTNLSQVATSSLSQTIWKDRVKKYGREGVTLLLNATSMLREIDGFKDFGPAYNNIKGRIDQALSRGYHAGQKGYLFQQKKQSQRIIKLFEAFSLKERKQFHKRFEGPPLQSGKTLTRKEALSIILNSGNPENIKAMLDSKELTEQDLQNIWNAAPKKYWDFAQSVWDYLDGFWPDIEATAMRRNGFAPEKVQAQARVTPHGVYRGGYYPLRYDNRRSGIPNSESIEEQRQRMRFGNFVSSHTAHGHMEERVGSGGRKLLYDPFVLNAHVDQVIYDLEVGDALRDAYRILHHRNVKEGLSAKGRNERFEGLELWLGDVTMGEMRLGGAVEESLRWLRTGYTVSKLAWNFSTIALQPLGLIQSGVQIGHGRMAKALAGVIGNALVGNFKVFEMVANETQFMAARWETWNRDIIDAQRQLSDSVLARYTPGKSAEVVQRTLFWGLKKAQMIVDTITWLAAHQKGLDDFKGDSQKAKDYADMMVARSQASGIFAERTALERGTASGRVRQSELTRAFTVLASYFMAKTNVAFERTKKTNFKSPVQVLMWAGDMAALYTVEAALAALIRGQWPDEEDEEDVGIFLLGETANAILAGVPILREFASEAKGFEGGGIVASVASQVGAFLKQAEQGEADEGLRKQSINLLGILLRAPSSQINKTLDAFSRAEEGYEVDFWDFIFGPPRD